MQKQKASYIGFNRSPKCRNQAFVLLYIHVNSMCINVAYVVILRIQNSEKIKVYIIFLIGECLICEVAIIFLYCILILQSMCQNCLESRTIPLFKRRETQLQRNLHVIVFILTKAILFGFSRCTCTYKVHVYLQQNIEVLWFY